MLNRRRPGDRRRSTISRGRSTRDRRPRDRRQRATARCDRVVTRHGEGEPGGRARSPRRRSPTGCARKPPMSSGRTTSWPRRPDRPHGRRAAPRPRHPVGAARLRQDDHRPAARRGAGNLAFEPLSATFSGVADLRKVFEPPHNAGVTSARAPCCSSTRSTASTAPSRTASCPTSRTARSP